MLGKGARDTLVEALDRFAQEGITSGLAVDIAAGEGRDSLELLGRGCQVLATDDHPDAAPMLWERVPEEWKERLTTEQVAFADTQLPQCDLVNASFALPFCCPEDFPVLREKIARAIRPGGRFAGQFFGDRDTWASIPGRSHHSHATVLQLLDGFEIELMNVEERDDPPDVYRPKHWHMFHVVARKKG